MAVCTSSMEKSGSKITDSSPASSIKYINIEISSIYRIKLQCVSIEIDKPCYIFFLIKFQLFSSEHLALRIGVTIFFASVTFPKVIFDLRRFFYGPLVCNIRRARPNHVASGASEGLSQQLFKSYLEEVEI